MKDELITQDCLPILAAMEDLSIDCVITDPPYPNGAGLFTDTLVDGLAGLYLCAKKARHSIVFFWTPLVDPPRPPPGWFHTATHIWHKPDAKSSIAYELIVVWTRDFRRQPRRVLEVPILDYRSVAFWKPLHPTQKPLRLMRTLVEIYTKEGDLVLDPFAGTGTTGVACKHAKRHWTMIERDPKYAEFAKERLTSAERTGEKDHAGQQPKEATEFSTEQPVNTPKQKPGKRQ